MNCKISPPPPLQGLFRSRDLGWARLLAWWTCLLIPPPFPPHFSSRPGPPLLSLPLHHSHFTFLSLQSIQPNFFLHSFPYIYLSHTNNLSHVYLWVGFLIHSLSVSSLLSSLLSCPYHFYLHVFSHAAPKFLYFFLSQITTHLRGMLAANHLSPSQRLKFAQICEFKGIDQWEKRWVEYGIIRLVSL